MRIRPIVVMMGLCLLAALALALMPSSLVMAQGGGGAVPIQIGQNAPGTLTADASTAQFTLMATGGEAVQIQVLAISAGFVPHFSVLNPAGVAILTASNADAKAVLTESVTLDDAGSYTIVVTGENGSTGQFLLSIQAGAALPAPIPLTMEQPVTATVGSQTPVAVYRFDATSAPVMLHVLSQTAGAQITLYDESASKTIASSDGSATGVVYMLPANGHGYRVEVRSAGSTDTVFSICIGACGSGGNTGNSGNGGNTGNTANPTAQATVAAPPTTCMASSSAGGAANLRSGPGPTYAVLGGLPLGQSVQVMAVWTGGGWYEVNANGELLWVGQSVINLTGDCTTLPKMAAPTNAQLNPTAVPTARPTVAPPISTPEVQPTPTQAAALPDLMVQGMTITQDSLTHARVTFDIYNIGTVDVTQPFYVYVCITTLCVEKQITLPVRAGSSTNVFVDLNHPSSNVPETVAVAVDSRGEIKELREDNNTTSLADVSLSF